MSMGIYGGGGGGGFGGGGNYQFNVNMNLTNLNMQFNQFNSVINNMANNVNNSFSNMGNTINYNFGNMNTQVARSRTLAGDLDAALGKVVGRAILIGGLTSAVRELAGAFNEANDAASKLGKGTSEWQESLQDLQAMTGRPGAVGEDVIQGQLDLMRAGMTRRQAHEAAETFGGEAQIMRENKVIPDAIYNQIQTRLANYAKSMGGDVTAVMRLGGQVARSMGAEASPEAVEQTTAEIFRRVGYGAGKSTALVEQVRKVIASNVLPGGAGNIQDAQTAATLVMGASYGTSAGRVGTSVEQTAAGLFGGTRGTEKFAEWMKTQGVTNRMDIYQRLRTIIPRLRQEAGMKEEDWEKGLRQTAEAEEGGDVEEEGKRIQQIFLEHGLKNAAVRRGLTAMMVNMGTMEKIQAEPQITRAEIDAGLQKFRESKPAEAARARGGLEAEQLEQGRRYQVRDILINQATADLTRAGRISPETLPQQALQDMLTGRSLLGGITTQQQMVYNQAVTRAVQRYGTDFRFGQGPGDTRITQAEILAGVRSGALTTEIEEAESRRRRRGNMAGPRGAATVEAYGGEGTASDIGGDVGREVGPALQWGNENLWPNQAVTWMMRQVGIVGPRRGAAAGGGGDGTSAEGGEPDEGRKPEGQRFIENMIPIWNDIRNHLFNISSDVRRGREGVEGTLPPPSTAPGVRR